VLAPFGGLPIPEFLSNLQIRSNLSFMFNMERMTGSVDFFNLRLFGFAEVVLWDTETGRKYSYRTVVGPRRNFIPYDLFFGRSSTQRKGRAIKMRWNRPENRFLLSARLAGNAHKPRVSISIRAQLDSLPFSEVAAVIPAPIMRRCRAVYRWTAPINGMLALTPLKSDTLTIPVSSGTALFDLHRAYYQMRTKSEYAFGLGKSGERFITFSLAASTIDAVKPDDYNENFLFCGEKMTPLPPVKITYPFGINGEWVIQDTESMVDLVFTPRSVYARMHSVFILTTRYQLIYGAFNGVLLTKTGEKIILKDFPGIAKKHLIRL
jgi:hypothetical protein